MLHEILQVLAQLLHSKSVVETTPSKSCPGCGLTPHDLAVTAKLGCARCYDAYKEEIGVAVPQLQNRHVGKRPRPGTVEDQVKLLKLQLQQCIDQENYEKAAVLKKTLERLLNGD